MQKEEKVKRPARSVPYQNVGTRSGAEVVKNVTSLVDAKLAYRLAKKRLLDVNNWNNYAGVNMTMFYLYSKRNTKLRRPAIEGDFIAIDIPGPGPASGKGYDWVHIEKIEETKYNENDMTVFIMQVRPCVPPFSSLKDVAHFYTSQATSSFIITRNGHNIKAEEQGRNEIANAAVESKTDSVRNKIVAFTASHGFAFPQWKKLMQGLIK